MVRKNVLFFVLSSLLFMAAPSFAQKTLSGYVKDAATGEALIGATIRVLESSTGAVADFEGFYQIALDKKAKTLVVSYTGYEAKTVDIGDATTIDVLLSTSDLLDEVLVVGYGIINKSDKTGAIESIKPKMQDVLQYNSFQDFLQGRAAGVQILSNGSELLSPNSIRIRGANSLRGDNEPLYVVDGIIVNSSTEDVADPLQGGSSFLSAQNGISGINAQDIESIEILKDASATAIYGSRGANGVIIITTKKGHSGKTKFSYRTTAKAGQATRLYDVLDSDGFASYINEYRAGQGWDPTFYTYGDGSIAPYANSVDFMEQNSDSIPRLSKVNWYDDILQRSFAQTHRLTASGGSEKNNFYIATGYTDATGNVPNTHLRKGDILLKYTHDLNDWLTISPRVSAEYTLNNASKGTDNLGSTNTSLMRQIVEAVPFKGFEDNNLGIEVEDALDGPRAWIEDYNDDSRELRTLASLTTDVKLSKIFTYRILGGVDYRTKERKLWYGTSLFRGRLANGEAGIGNLNRIRYNLDQTLRFNYRHNKNHTFNGTVGFVVDNTTVNQSGATSSNFANHELRYDGIAFGQTFTPYQFDRLEETILSFLGRVNYTFRKNYLFTVSFREDGSSKFSKDNRWSFFPSAAFAWKMMNEPFFENSKVWSEAKLRVGYGRTGSQAIRPYQTLTRFTPTTNLLSNGQGGGVTAVLPQNLGNANLIWETTEQLNAGFDFGFLSDRITGAVDVYQKKTIDLLQFLNIGPSVGFPSFQTNLGDLQNRGIDASLNAYLIDKSKFKWRAFATFSRNRAKINNLGVPEAQFGTTLRKAIIGANVAGGTIFKVPANIFIEGEQPGLFWGYQTDGIILDDAMLTNAPAVQGVASQLGDVLYVDQDGDGNITETDLTIIGNPNPNFTLGFGSEFSYKSWNLNFFVNSVQGFDVANGNLGRQAIPTGLTNNIRSEVYDGAWREGSTNATYPRLGYSTKGDFTDRMVEDGSFVRLSFVTLGYSLKTKAIKGIESVNIFLSGHNLLLLTDYTGFDPEVNSFSHDPTRVGIDWNAFPNQKSVSAGLNIEF